MFKSVGRKSEMVGSHISKSLLLLFCFFCSYLTITLSGERGGGEGEKAACGMMSEKLVLQHDHFRKKNKKKKLFFVSDNVARFLLN